MLKREKKNGGRCDDLNLSSQMIFNMFLVPSNWKKICPMLIASWISLKRKFLFRIGIIQTDEWNSRWMKTDSDEREAKGVMKEKGIVSLRGRE